MKDEELDKLLDQWKTPETPPWFKTKVMQAVREDAVPEAHPLVVWWKRWWIPQMAVPALAILLLTLWLGYVSQPDQVEPAAEVVELEEALESFVSFSYQEAWEEEPFL